jgi:hypothetical protein
MLHQKGRERYLGGEAELFEFAAEIRKNSYRKGDGRSKTKRYRIVQVI